MRSPAIAVPDSILRSARRATRSATIVVAIAPTAVATRALPYLPLPGVSGPSTFVITIGATIRVLLVVADLHPLIAGRPCEELAHRLFPDYEGMVPAGAYPPGWVAATA